MVALIFLVLNLISSLFKPRSRLEAENAALRHQLIVLQRKVRGRVEFTNSDRLFFIQLYRWFPSILKAMMIIRPETIVRWHRTGMRRYWRWKSRNPGGRPPSPGAPSCAAICRTSQPWICSWFRPSALTCSTFWSLSGWLGESLYGSM
jgi:hypothetical protein